MPSKPATTKSSNARRKKKNEKKKKYEKNDEQTVCGVFRVLTAFCTFSLLQTYFLSLSFSFFFFLVVGYFSFSTTPMRFAFL